MSITLADEKVHHSRRIYSLLDMFGDFGGVLEVGTIFFTFFCGSWAEFHYYIKAIQKLVQDGELKVSLVRVIAFSGTT